MPGGMVAELFQAAGAKTPMLPGSEILDALAKDTLDAADYTGQAVNLALGFQKVAKYDQMGPPGFMSIHHLVIGRAHVCTPVTNEQPVRRLMLDKKNNEL